MELHCVYFLKDYLSDMGRSLDLMITTILSNLQDWTSYHTMRLHSLQLS